MKGYKIFNPDWTCRGKQYTCPGEFKEDIKPSVCNRGMHFCKKMVDCFDYYSGADETYKYAEVEALGDVVTDRNKSCTNHLKIVRELTFEEVKSLTNTGNRNTGNRNTGDCNTGNCNTGNCNTGNWNTGDWNTGNWNTGDWNTCTGAAGCFCTEQLTIPMFNKPSNMTLEDWWECEARDYLNEIQKDVVEWISESRMSDDEKQEHPTYKTAGGYLKILDGKDNAQNWWNNAAQYKKDAIMALPNFDAEIFRQCTGIDISFGKGDKE